jgi:hypothetical protein
LLNAWLGAKVPQELPPLLLLLKLLAPLLL